MAILGPNGVLGAGLEGEIAVRTDVGGGRNWIFKGYGELILRGGGKELIRFLDRSEGWSCR